MVKLVGDDVPSIEQFMSRYRVSNLLTSLYPGLTMYRWTTLPHFTEYKLECLRLSSTLAKPGQKPVNGSPRQHKCVSGVSDYLTVSKSWLQSFITFMDALKLRMRAKDQLHPILQELVTGYARFKGSKDWEGRSKMVAWYACFRS